MPEASLERLRAVHARMKQELHRVIVGQDQVIDELLLAILSRGHCLLGTEVRPVKQFDLITIPAWTLHQFRATEGEPMGFLCMVNNERDKPQLPDADEVAALRRDAKVAAFLDGKTA